MYKQARHRVGASEQGGQQQHTRPAVHETPFELSPARLLTPRSTAQEQGQSGGVQDGMLQWWQLPPDGCADQRVHPRSRDQQHERAAQMGADAGDSSCGARRSGAGTAPRAVGEAGRQDGHGIYAPGHQHQNCGSDQQDQGCPDSHAAPGVARIPASAAEVVAEQAELQAHRDNVCVLRRRQQEAQVAAGASKRQASACVDEGWWATAASSAVLGSPTAGFIRRRRRTLSNRLPVRAISAIW